MFLEILHKVLTSPDGLCLTKPCCKRSLSIHFPLGIFFRVSLAFFVSFQCGRAVLKSCGSPSRGLRRRSIASDHLLRSNTTPGSVALTTCMVTVADPGEGPGGHPFPPPPTLTFEPNYDPLISASGTGLESEVSSSLKTRELLIEM